MICAGCDKEKPHKARGLCNACYVTWQRTGSTDRVRQPRGGHCSVEGCDKPVHGRGLCEMHLRRQRKTGTLSKPIHDASNSPALHPVYPQWVDFKRARGSRDIVLEWGNDFWAFAAAVGDRPTPRSRLNLIIKTLPLGPGNFEWREPIVTRKGDETRAEYMQRYSKEHRAANVDMYRGHNLSRRYGLTTEEYDAMAEAQNHKCAICGQAEKDTNGSVTKLLAVDHDHVTDKVRGLLCKHCNVGIGHFKDDTTLLAKAIAYLASHQA